MRLALHTWQINSVIKPNNLSFMDTNGKETVTRAPNLLSLNRVPPPLSWCFRGYFHPLFISLEEYHSVFRAARPSQAMSEDSKSYSEWSIWILTVKCNAHCFSQYYHFQNQKIIMLENRGYITELTAWHCYQGHMSECLTRGKPFPLF